MMKRAVLVVIVLGCILTSAAYAAGTSAGQSIIARATSLNATYDDGVSGVTQNLDKTQLSDESTNVLEIFGLLYLSSGLSGISDIDQVVTGGIGSVLVRRMVVQNHANTQDVNLHFATGNYVLSKAPGDASTEAQWLAATTLWWSATALDEDADALVTIGVTVPAGVVNGTSWNILVSANTTSTPVRKYQGFNTSEYGGYSDITRNALFQVQGFPYLELITRNILITSPAQYTGNAHDAVPGAKLRYTMVLENRSPTATAGAKELVFVDHVPARTTYYIPDPIAVTADDGVAFTMTTTNGTLTWTQNNSATNALLVGHRVTLNFTVTID